MNRRTPFRLAWTALAVLAVMVLNIPFLTSLWTSIKSTGDLAQTPLRWPSSLTLEHYASIFARSDFDFLGFFINSLTLSLGAVALVALVGVPAAYGIVRLGIGGSRTLSLVMSLRIVPAIFLMIPFYLMFGSLGLLDSLTSLIVANAVVNLPVAMLIYSSAFRDIPDSIEDAAVLDGCSSLRTLSSVMLPLVRPALASAALLTFVFSWSDYIFGLVLTSQRATPLTVGASNFVTSAGIQWGDLAAAATLSVIPPLLIAIFAQNHFVKGIAAGAVKE
jgi:multiple sugar transport system permease protein